MQSALLWIYTESSLHAGTGSGVSVIDLPIQRERTTQYPNIQGSGIKGALRSQTADRNSPQTLAVFGPETDAAQEYAGALALGEARVVLFPVRSLMGIFAYATCPFALNRLARDAARAGIATPDPISAPDDSGCWVNGQSNLIIHSQAVLDEFSFAAQADGRVDDWAGWLAGYALPGDEAYTYFRDKVTQSLVILPDNAFRDFVLNNTEVVTRVRIQPESKTVQDGALWTQEALPADTLLVSTATARQLRAPESDVLGSLSAGTAQAVLEWITNPDNLPRYVQIGGDETVGQGLVALNWQT